MPLIGVPLPRGKRSNCPMRSRAVFILTFAVMIAGVALPAMAQRMLRVQSRPVVAACAEDYRRLCPGVRPGAGRVIVCLNAQAEKLSQDCFQALAGRGLAFAAALRLCRPDFERLCPDVAPGMGRGLACLLDNLGRVSPDCRKTLSAHGFGGDRED